MEEMNNNSNNGNTSNSERGHIRSKARKIKINEVSATRCVHSY